MEKFLNKEGLIFYNNKIKGELDKKVSKIEGKGLSTNDYTSDEKAKLASIESNAQANKIESITVNGSNQTVSSKTVNINVPTNNNQLSNGAGYQTANDVQNAINSAVSNIVEFDVQVVASLPATGERGIIYLVSRNGSGTDIYDEYIYLVNDNKFEKVGSTDVDLTGYYNTSNLTAITNAEIDEMLVA